MGQSAEVDYSRQLKQYRSIPVDRFGNHAKESAHD